MKKENPSGNSSGGIPGAAVYISVYIIAYVDNEARILLIKRKREPYKNIWQPVTGRIEYGEKAWQAALRELREETGLVPDRFYSADFVEQFYDMRNEILAHCPAFVGYIDKEVDVILSDEHSEFAWVPDDKAIEMVVFTEQKKAIEHLRKYCMDNEPQEYLRIEI